MSPGLLLIFCFIVGSGMALFGPAWQASVNEQVPVEALPAAVALNGISYNIARSFGPAIGGVIVAVAGSVSAFATNAAFYLPLLVALYLWRRVSEPSRLPPEGLARAVISGVRYILNSPPIRIVLGRTLATGIGGGSVAALLPLVARDLLHGGAQTYGIMLGAFGMGAVIGALNLSRLRAHFTGEASVRLCAIVMGAGIAVVAMSSWPAVTGCALLFVGAGWTASVTLFNVGVQLSSPRWVSGRALAAFQAAIAGGIAVGSWAWGYIASHIGVERTLLISAAVLVGSPVLARWMRMPPVGARNEQAMEVIADPEVRLSLSARSGPIVVEIEYRVDLGKARLFYAIMQRVQLSRQRNGAYGGRSRATSPIPSCGRSAIIARPGTITSRGVQPRESERMLQRRALRFPPGSRVRVHPAHARAADRVGAMGRTPHLIGRGLEVEPVAGVTGGP